MANRLYLQLLSYPFCYGQYLYLQTIWTYRWNWPNLSRRLSLLKTIITTYLNRLLKEVMELVIKERNSNRVYATVPILLTLNVNNFPSTARLGNSLLGLCLNLVFTTSLPNTYLMLLTLCLLTKKSLGSCGRKSAEERNFQVVFSRKYAK